MNESTDRPPDSPWTRFLKDPLAPFIGALFGVIIPLTEKSPSKNKKRKKEVEKKPRKRHI